MDLVQIFLDTETTGIDQNYDSIIQLSCVVRVNNKETERHNWYMKPYKRNLVLPEATKVHGITQEMASQFPDNKEALKEFREMLFRYNLCKEGNKAWIIGYNVNFDIQMIKAWFEHNGYNDLWSYIYTPDIDMMRVYGPIFMIKGIRPFMKNFKQPTLYSMIYNEDLEGAHNAMADVEASMRLYDSYASKYFPETL